MRAAKVKVKVAVALGLAALVTVSPGVAWGAGRNVLPRGVVVISHPYVRYDGRPTPSAPEYLFPGGASTDAPTYWGDTHPVGR